MMSRRTSGLVATLALVGAYFAPSGQAHAQAPQPGDFFIAIGDGIYNIAGGGDFTSAAPWAGNVPISVGQLESICIGPNGYVYASEYGGNVFEIQAGGDQSSLTPFATSGGAYNLGGMWCSSTEVYVTAPLQGAVYDVAAGGDMTAMTPFVTGATEILDIDMAPTPSFLGIGLNGQYWDITGGAASSLGSDSIGTNYFGFAVNAGPQMLASREISGEIVDVTAGGELSTATVFADLPGGGGDLLYIEGLGMFAFDRGSDEVFEITAGGSFTAGTGFAQMPQGGDLGGMAYVHGCGDGVLWTSGGEECDDGVNNSDTTPDACRTSCLDPSCGDDVIDTGEECDDGVDNSDTTPDACRTTCANAACGDGVTDTGEECDDGNTSSGDGCSDICEDEGTGGAGGGTGGAGAMGGTGGTGAVGGTGGSPAADDSEDESGCGCRAVGSSHSAGSYGMVALGLLGLAGLGRRRRRQ